MKLNLRKSLQIAIAGCVLSAGAAFAQQQEGLVNVNVGDIQADIARDLDVNVSQVPVTVQAPIGVAANVCDVSAAVLARQRAEGASCDAKSTSRALNDIVQRRVGDQPQ